jgi:hypothetical protein
MGGDDPLHDLPADEKDRIERQLRDEGRKLRRDRKPREAKRQFDRANEISRDKSKRAHQS